MTSVILNWHPLHGAGEALGHLLRLLTSCTTLGMGYCSLTGEDIQDIVNTLEDKTPPVRILN